VVLNNADQGTTEIGAFGIGREEDPLFIDDVVLVRQSCTAVTVKFDDAAVADFFDQQIDLGRKPEQFARVWLHSHPGSSAQPSLTDEKTFDRVFGHCDWALMGIVARGGESYARLRFNLGPMADLVIRMDVEWSEPFASSDQPGWLAEYKAAVSEEISLLTTIPDRWPGLDVWGERDFAAAFW
jgi:proteasome lid subunit RPN8/RPN11